MAANVVVLVLSEVEVLDVVEVVVDVLLEVVVVVVDVDVEVLVVIYSPFFTGRSAPAAPCRVSPSRRGAPSAILSSVSWS